MRFLIPAGFLVAVSSVASRIPWDMFQSISEVGMLTLWGAALLLIGRQVRARRDEEQEEQVRPVAASTRTAARLRSPGAGLEAHV